MAIEIKQSLKLSQQLIVTPQLQQAIKLLQLSQIELSEMIQKELVENPLLEEKDIEMDESEDKTASEKHESAKAEANTATPDEEVGDKDGLTKEPSDFDWENYINLYNSSEIREERERPDDRPTYENFVTKSENLQEHLLWQLKLNDFNEQEQEIATEIIGSINDDGYFIGDINSIANTVNLDSIAVEKVLNKVQEFDPAGVAARNLEECLLLQVCHIDQDRTLLEHIIKNHMQDMEHHDYECIAQKINVSESKIKELVHTISLLEPKPGRPYSGETPQYVTPDVFVYKVGDSYVVTLNDEGMPRLRVSDFYRKAMMPGAGTESKTKEYIQEKMRAAIWLIRSIHQRQRTLRRVSNSIVKFQKSFFDKGSESLKPLVLREVADDIGMHESTISRITTNKYMHTPHGIFELKFFFNTGLSTSDGEGIATQVVREKIKTMVGKEDSFHPISDQQIAVKLKTQDISIARRTVAKYRESLGIPSSSARRKKR